MPSEICSLPNSSMVYKRNTVSNKPARSKAGSGRDIGFLNKSGIVILKKKRKRQCQRYNGDQLDFAHVMATTIMC